MIEEFLTWARAEERRDVEIPAIAYRRDGKRLGVLISNLSYDGCLIATQDEVAEGDPLTIVIFELGAEIETVVRWTKDGKLGVRFTGLPAVADEG